MLKDVDIVYHLITTTFPSSTLDSCIFDIQSNLIPTVKLVEACLQNQVSQLIYASSGGTVYGEPQFLPITEEHPLNPQSIYGQSKLMIEQLLNFLCPVYSVVYQGIKNFQSLWVGQKILGIQGLVAVAMGCALYDREIKILGEGDAVRDYIFIDDVINALIASIEYPENITVNIASAEGKSIKDIIQGIEQVTGKVLKKAYLPERPGDVKINVLSNHLAKNLLNWSPKSGFHESLEMTWRSLLSQ